MARLARAVAAGVPHHVMQRGNPRQQTFFSEVDCEAYRELLAAACRRHGVAVLANCLMANHVHLILVPNEAAALRLALGETHQRYGDLSERRHGWVGHLWQRRFTSCALDGPDLVAAVRYIELNPVRARLADGAAAWPWSSARAHLAARDDGLMTVVPLLDAGGDWSAFLAVEPRADEMDTLRQHERTGRPLGDGTFVATLEAGLGRRLRLLRPGRRRGRGEEGLVA